MCAGVRLDRPGTALLGRLAQHASARVLLALGTAVLAVCPLALGWSPSAGQGAVCHLPGGSQASQEAPVSCSVCPDTHASCGAHAGPLGGLRESGRTPALPRRAPWA